MTTARSSQICLESTPWYHCTTRCVRRAFLCGIDSLSQRNFNHRKQWIEDRILKVSSVFCIDIGAYAVMDNHYHVVLKVDTERANSLSDYEVLQRWSGLYKLSNTAKKRLNHEALSDNEQLSLQQDLIKWKHELCNISRFMAEINQYIARRANTEDGCKGRFWEARFHSQAILDDDALLRTLIYVDLNPYRAGLTEIPSAADHTSIKRRQQSTNTAFVPFQAASQSAKADVKNLIKISTGMQLPISLPDYLNLLNWTASYLNHQPGEPRNLDQPSCFESLNFSKDQWLRTQSAKIHWHQKALGSKLSLRKYCRSLKKHWIWASGEHQII